MSRKKSNAWMGPLPAATGCDCQICRPEESYDDLDRQVIDTVLERGWQVISVTGAVDCCAAGQHEHRVDALDKATDPHDPAPAFAYTIGLGHRLGQPELLVSGMDHALMQHVLNAVAARMMTGHLCPSPGDVIEGVLPGAPLLVEEVSDDGLGDTVLWAGWFNRCKPRALALVWPTTSGVFAWQPGAPARLEELQPSAWRIPAERTGAVAVDPTWTFPIPAETKVCACTHVVEDGAVVLFAVRHPDERPDEDEDYWVFDCGAEDHTLDTMCLVHLAHLVRAAPSIRALGLLQTSQFAERDDADDEWSIGRFPAEALT